MTTLAQMTKEDLQQMIAAAVNEAVREELTVEMEWEQHRDPETGAPLATPRYTKEVVFLPAFFCQHLKFHEGAYRGNQETIDHAKNNLSKLDNRVGVMGQSFLTFQEPMVVLERFVGLLVKSGIMDRIEDATGPGLIGPVSENNDGERPNAGDNR